MAGITLTIQSSVQKYDEKVQITYPIVKGLRFNLNNRRGVMQDTSTRARDSVMNGNNKILEQNCKLIRITGVKGLDTLISVYNTDGVKAAGLFNNKKGYTLELGISLKHLGFLADNRAKFAYHIQINGKKSFSLLPLLLLCRAHRYQRQTLRVPSRQQMQE